jgi:hypothetical protein
MRKTMKLIGTLPVLLLSALLLVASDLGADDTAVKQLEALGTYPTATRVSEAASPSPSPSDSSQSEDVQRKADELTHEFNMRRENNKVYEIVILGVVALLSLFLVLRFLGAKSNTSAPHIVNATGLICIIFGTIMLVLMAQSDQQLTAAVGILGAVAGYLFRSMHQEEDAKTPT